MDSCLIVSLIEKVIKRSVWQNAPFLFYNLVVSLKDLFLFVLGNVFWVGFHTMFVHIQTFNLFLLRYTKSDSFLQDEEYYKGC